MNPTNQITIQERETVYDIKYTYHSDKRCQNYDAEITGVEEADGNITIKPGGNPLAVGFVFDHSDPDRIIAIAQMMLAFAHAIKKESQKAIDTDACA